MSHREADVQKIKDAVAAASTAKTRLETQREGLQATLQTVVQGMEAIGTTPKNNAEKLAQLTSKMDEMIDAALAVVDSVVI